MKYTGIRTRLTLLKFNAFIEMGLADADEAVARSRERLREQLRAYPYPVPESLADDLEPWEVKPVPAGWGYPERVVVTW